MMYPASTDPFLCRGAATSAASAVPFNAPCVCVILWTLAWIFFRFNKTGRNSSEARSVNLCPRPCVSQLPATKLLLLWGYTNPNVCVNDDDEDVFFPASEAAPNSPSSSGARQIRCRYISISPAIQECVLILTLRVPHAEASSCMNEVCGEIWPHVAGGMRRAECHRHWRLN